MITGRQIREARRLLGWPAHRMEHRCKIGTVTLAKAERSEGRPDLKDVTLAKIKVALEAAGVEFDSVSDDSTGVRFRNFREGSEAVTKLVQLSNKSLYTSDESKHIACDSIQFLVAPDIVRRGSGGAVKRSIQPGTLVMHKIDQTEWQSLRRRSWTHAAWFDQETQTTVECQVRRLECDGANLKIIF